MPAPVFTKQILRDTVNETTVKLTGQITSGNTPDVDPANTTIDVSSLYGALDSSRANVMANVTNTGVQLSVYRTSISYVDYDVVSAQAGGYAVLAWKGNTGSGQANTDVFTMSGPGEFNAFPESMVIPFNGTANGANSGDLIVQTVGITTGAYTITVRLRKNNEDFQHGQFDDRVKYSN